MIVVQGSLLRRLGRAVVVKQAARRLLVVGYIAAGYYSSFIINRLAADCPLHQECHLATDTLDITLLALLAIVTVGAIALQELGQLQVRRTTEVAILNDFVMAQSKTIVSMIFDEAAHRNVSVIASVRPSPEPQTPAQQKQLPVLLTPQAESDLDSLLSDKTLQAAAVELLWSLTQEAREEIDLTSERLSHSIRTPSGQIIPLYVTSCSVSEPVGWKATFTHRLHIVFTIQNDNTSDARVLVVSVVKGSIDTDAFADDIASRLSEIELLRSDTS